MSAPRRVLCLGVWLLGACGTETPQSIDDVPLDDVAADLVVDVAPDQASPDVSDVRVAGDVLPLPDATRVVSTTADRLAVMPVSWNPANTAVGTVAAVAESAASRALFGSLGVQVFVGGAVAGRDATTLAWRGAAAVPSGVPVVGDAGRPPEWLLGVDGMGRVMRVREDFTLEAVGDRYAVGGMQSVLAVGYAGATWVGFWTSTHIAVANGTRVMRYMNGPFTSFAAGAMQFAGAAADRIDVLAPATGQQRSFRLAGVTALALTGEGRVVAAVGDTVWSELPDGTLEPVYRAPAPVRSMARSGARVWFVAGTELATLVGTRASITQGLALPAGTRLTAGLGDAVWALRGAMAPMLYRATTVMLTPEEQWVETVQPVYARRCGGMCHGPPPTGRQTNLSTYNAWVTHCRAIRARTITWTAASMENRMPLSGAALMGDERTAVDAWTRARCP
jgi:hypothetical protein